ncbi:MAG: cupin domain-containing protein [Negativicutes bacterium]|nr:cupin domain-containing protein [Negativicutes bacterium]
MAKEQKYVYSLKDIPYIQLADKAKTRFVLGEDILVSFIEQEPGAQFPIHSHDCEQILYIIEGTEDHIIGDQTILMKAGDVCVHPANVPHGGRTTTGFKGVDIFSPPRKEHVDLMKKHGQA